MTPALDHDLTDAFLALEQACTHANKARLFGLLQSRIPSDPSDWSVVARTAAHHPKADASLHLWAITRMGLGVENRIVCVAIRPERDDVEGLPERIPCELWVPGFARRLEAALNSQVPPGCRARVFPLLVNAFHWYDGGESSAAGYVRLAEKNIRAAGLTFPTEFDTLDATLPVSREPAYLMFVLFDDLKNRTLEVADLLQAEFNPIGWPALEVDQLPGRPMRAARPREIFDAWVDLSSKTFSAQIFKSVFELRHYLEDADETSEIAPAARVFTTVGCGVQVSIEYGDRHWEHLQVRVRASEIAYARMAAIQFLEGLKVKVLASTMGSPDSWTRSMNTRQFGRRWRDKRVAPRPIRDWSIARLALAAGVPAAPQSEVRAAEGVGANAGARDAREMTVGLPDLSLSSLFASFFR